MSNFVKIVYSINEIFKELKTNEKIHESIYIYVDEEERVYFLSLSPSHDQIDNVSITDRFKVLPIRNFNIKHFDNKITECLNRLFPDYMQINTDGELAIGLGLVYPSSVVNVDFVKKEEELTIGNFGILKVRNDKLSIVYNGLNYTLTEVDGHLVLNRNMLCKRG